MTKKESNILVVRAFIGTLLGAVGLCAAWGFSLQIDTAGSEAVAWLVSSLAVAIVGVAVVVPWRKINE